MCRSPREVIIEQGLHPNPGPDNGRRKITTKSKPEDVRRAEDGKKKELSEMVESQYSPLITEGKGHFSNREGGEEATHGGREPGLTENTPNKKPAPIPKLKKIKKTPKKTPKALGCLGKGAPPH